MTKLNGITLSASMLAPSAATPASRRLLRAAGRTVQFSFVGEITAAVLHDGKHALHHNHMPASWAGGRVSGVLSIDMERAAGGVTGPQGFAYADDTLGSDWISVAVRNPDGSLFELPAPLPAGAGATDMARVTLNTGNDHAGTPLQPGFFEIERRLRSGDAEQAFVLDLGGHVGSPTWPHPDANGALALGTTQVDVAYADRTNRGMVCHRVAPGEGYVYTFSFLSVTHMAPVAEAGDWASLARGLGLVGWARRLP